MMGLLILRRGCSRRVMSCSHCFSEGFSCNKKNTVYHMSSNRSQCYFTARPVSHSDGRARTTVQGYSLC